MISKGTSAFGLYVVYCNCSVVKIIVFPLLEVTISPY